MPSRSLSLLVLIIGVTAISFGSIFVRLCNAPALIIAAYRLGFATLLFLPIQFWGKEEKREAPPQGGWVIYLAAGGFLALHFATWISSLNYTSVASSVVLVTTNPLFVALFSWWFLREKITRRAMMGVLVAFLGGVVIAHVDAGHSMGSLKGDLLALLGAVMMSGYILTGRSIRTGTSLKQYLVRVYGMAALILVVYCMLTEPNWIHFSGKTYLFFVLSALVPQAIGHTSINWGLRYFPATLVAVCTLLEPVGASLLALLIFREMLSIEKVVGGFILLVGVYLTLRETKEMEPAI